MQKDNRLQQMAENILTNSVKLKKGEKIYIEAFDESTRDLFNEFIKAAVKKGAIPFYSFNDGAFIKSVVENALPQQMQEMGKIYAGVMEQCQAYIGIRGNDDIFALADINPAKMANFQKFYSKVVHSDIRVAKTKWCIMRYPNNTMAALSRMSTQAFEDFYFKACLLDYKKMDKAMNALEKIMTKTSKVKIIAPNTNLEFSIKGLGAIKCAGECNIPDGEVYTAPVKNSINGRVQFNTDTTYNGVFYSNVCLDFENGKIVKATSLANNDKLQKLLKTDDGSVYMGEFALGVNPYITHPILDILFDEKICGSFHMAIGNSYDNMDNGNKSAIHWDLVQIQTPQWGGGEIWFDDKLIRKNGQFVVKELEFLNPENLK